MNDRAPMRSAGDDFAIVGAHYALPWDEQMIVRRLTLLDPAFWMPWLRAKATQILASYPDGNCPRLTR